MPRVSASSAPAKLFFGDEQGSFLRTRSRGLHRCGIGGMDGQKMMDRTLPAKDRPAKKRRQLLGADQLVIGNVPHLAGNKICSQKKRDMLPHIPAYKVFLNA